MELCVHDLTKCYGHKCAVDHLSLTLSAGIYGLLGANGSGKTTLMRQLCVLQRPTGGRITWDGRDIRTMGEDYRKLLGYLPQDFCCYPDFTALEFMDYIGTLKGLSGAQLQSKFMELLAAVGLADVARRKTRTFSGGMKQRLGIAQALLGNPRILILDEPTTGLDPKERVRFRNLLREFSGNRIIILSTHIVSDVQRIADKIIIMRAGQLLHFGSMDELALEITGDANTLPELEELYIMASREGICYEKNDHLRA